MPEPVYPPGCHSNQFNQMHGLQGNPQNSSEFAEDELKPKSKNFKMSNIISNDEVMSSIADLKKLIMQKQNQDQSKSKSLYN